MHTSTAVDLVHDAVVFDFLVSSEQECLFEFLQ